ncbi:MAG: leucyl aminopeptidase [Candidatus Margulisiibacteriota bacterium]|nr:leucyl aminopeptidase [Candidatus Margulisiibacteriota bacterium]
MKVSVQNISLTKFKCDLLVVNIFEKVKKPGGATGVIDDSMENHITKLISSGEIEGKLGEKTLIHTFEGLPACRVVVIGLGKREDFGLDKARVASAAGIRVGKQVKAKKVATIIHGAGFGGFDIADAAQATVEGAILGAYEFDGNKTEKAPHQVKDLVLVEKDRRKVKLIKIGARIGEIVANAENNARDLVNSPSNKVTPTYFAKYAQKMAKAAGLKCTVLDPKKRGMAAIHAIAKGSKEPAKMVVLQTRASTRGPRVALIGKGVTFDAGGISLKPSKKLWEMKIDMAGAAAVAEVMRAISQLKLKKDVIAVIPLTENMPGGGALKPGDVVSSLSGITTEIISTDAEGRMILADAITYAKRLGAKIIVDCATLTGGCITALGETASGIMGNSDKLIEDFKAAAERTGEKVWPLPLFKEYKKYLRSTVADQKNCTEGMGASPSVGGTFLHKFAGNTPWVHLDIAGTANISIAKGYLKKGATGVPVRTLVEFIKS